MSSGGRCRAADDVERRTMSSGGRCRAAGVSRVLARPHNTLQMETKRVKQIERCMLCLAVVVKNPNNKEKTYEKGDMVFLPVTYLDYGEVNMMRVDLEDPTSSPEHVYFATGKVPSPKEVCDEDAPDMILVQRIRAENRVIYLFPDPKKQDEDAMNTFERACDIFDRCVDEVASRFAKELFGGCERSWYCVADRTEAEVHALVTEKWNDADKVRASAGRIVLACEFERSGHVAEIMKDFEDVPVPRLVCIYDLSQPLAGRRKFVWQAKEFVEERKKRMQKILDVIEPLVPSLQKRANCKERLEAEAKVKSAIELSNAYPSDKLMNRWYGPRYECPKLRIDGSYDTMTNSYEDDDAIDTSAAELLLSCNTTPYENAYFAFDHAARTMGRIAERRSRELCGLDPPSEPEKGAVPPLRENEVSGLCFV